MGYKKILVAPLDWGLGHATRCIPLIRGLEKEQFEPVLAGDGASFKLLRKEFPHLKNFQLPSYNIKYSKDPRFLKLKLAAQAPHIAKTISEERRITDKLVTEEKLSGIISDNRWGTFSSEVPSVFITHQINVFSGWSTFFSSKLQQKLIRNFVECWVPDTAGEPNLSGRLGHFKNFSFPVKYIGILSRFEKVKTPIKYDILALLSGPEPQRTLFENILLQELPKLEQKILLIRGVVENEKTTEEKGNIQIVNYLDTAELQQVINESEIVICRSGYSSIMDLIKLQKKAFLIPTPGQPEQEYLARRMLKKGFFPFCSQNDFTSEKLNDLSQPTISSSTFSSSFFDGNGIPAGCFTLFKGE